MLILLPLSAMATEGALAPQWLKLLHYQKEGGGYASVVEKGNFFLTEKGRTDPKAEYDEAIKAFLETSDWTLSQKISPPPIVEEGHYLCTVSLRGHKNIVKPTRMGIRRGKKIVVNSIIIILNVSYRLCF